MTHVQSLAGLVYYSPRPDDLAAFYRDALGVPFQDAEHGNVGQHREGLLGSVHFAIWEDKKGHGGGAANVPTFRVDDLQEAHDELVAGGATRVHKIIDLGEGKRVAGFADPDGRAFRLIDLGGATAPAPRSADDRDAVSCVSAVVFFSADPERLAAFTAAHLGIRFESNAHPSEHHESKLGDMRFAILREPEAGSRRGAFPTFLVRGLDRFVARLGERGTALRGAIVELGDGKRLASFTDPDGNPFQLVDLGFDA